MSGALLMPRLPVIASVQDLRGSATLSAAELGSVEGAELIAGVARAYDVSHDAARVRLQKLRLIAEPLGGQTLAFR
jgi:hypothetical protein